MRNFGCFNTVAVVYFIRSSALTKEIECRGVYVDKDLLASWLWLRCLLAVPGGELIECVDVRVNDVTLHAFVRRVCMSGVVKGGILRCLSRC